MLLVLACVWVEGQDGGDALSGAALERVDHNELLHQPLVERLGMGLHHEAVGTTDGLLEANEDLTIGEIARGGWNQIGLEFLGHSLSQRWVSAPSEEHHVLAAAGNLASHR